MKEPKKQWKKFTFPKIENPPNKIKFPKTETPCFIGLKGDE
jgi:hypothetical protein